MTPEDVSRLARGMDLAEDQLVRELLQARLVATLFASNARNAFALKGGLAMRMLHGSMRLTKDVDLQGNPALRTAHARSLVREAIKTTLAGGLLRDVEVTEPKQTETVQRFKINGFLAGGESQVHLTVEVSRRGMPPSEFVSRIPMRGPTPETSGHPVDAYTADLISLNKIDALLSPTRFALRDVWDLDVLIAMEVKPPMRLLAGIGQDAIDEALSQLWSKLELMTYAHVKEQLIPFMRPQDAERLDEESWDAMRLRVGERVESWLSEARGMKP